MNKKIILFPFFLFFTSLFLPVIISKTFYPTVSVFSSSIDDTDSIPKENPTYISVFNAAENKNFEKELEEYLTGVVIAEMPGEYEEEALKAQAVAARTYILNKTGNKNSGHEDAVVCTSPSHCKGYTSPEEAAEKFGHSWINKYLPKIQKAVTDTEGEFIAYDKKPIEAYFFALSNGYTENSGEVWTTDLPYLKSCDSSFDSSSPNFISTAEFSLTDFNERLCTLRSDYSPSELPNIFDIVLSKGQRIKSLKINGTLFKGSEIRTAFGLKSTDFSIEFKNKNVVFTVKGNGHGVGMSQYGANILAKKGKNYKDILKYYYKGIEIITK